MVGFEETKKYLNDADNIIVTGTPTKIKKINVEKEQKEQFLSNIGIKNKLPIVLIFGGSQGAQKINEAVYNLILKKLNNNYQIIWATGPKQFDIFKEKFEKENININNLENVKILPYIYDMEELMNISDLLVCRSGAMTITEISIVGKPAIFVPLPSKMANRQEDNAKVLESIGAAQIILNDEINFEILSKKINDIINDEKKLNDMGRLAKTLAPENVEEKIYNEIESVCKNK